MNYWSIKEVAEQIGVTYQAIYKNREKFLKKGYLEEIDGTLKVTLSGYNYLISKKKKVEPIKEPGANAEVKNEYIEVLKDRIKHLEEELKENKKNYQEEIERERTRTAYFKTLFEQKDRQVTMYLLPGGTEEEQSKKGIFKRLFKK